KTKIQKGETKSALYQRMIRDTPPTAQPGIVRLVREATHAGLALELATTTGRENANTLMECLFDPDLAARLEVRICGEDVRAKKSDPEVYCLAFVAIDLDPRETVAIEDSAADLEAASTLGIGCVVTPALYTRLHDFSGAPVSPATWEKPMRRARCLLTADRKAASLRLPISTAGCA
ncbi:HAD-IA family hydrolase, partial [Aphanothece microscopica]|uniref:HAD-IA family hydrolase n=1 Tax=Aphanothece microscopica TaxID=1049561 RepID=UPI0039847E5A